MNQRPECAIKGCTNPALILFGDQWICGECLVTYDRKIKENQFNLLQEVLKNDSNNLSKMPTTSVS